MSARMSLAQDLSISRPSASMDGGGMGQEARPRHATIFHRSEAWEKKYFTLRNCVEGFNGYVRTEATKPLTPSAVASGAWRRRASSWRCCWSLRISARSEPLGELAAQKDGKLRRLPPRRRTRDLETWLPAASAGAVEPEPPPRMA